MTGEHATEAQQPGDVEGEAHGAGDHGGDHGHDDHGHESETIGPVDVQAWGAFILGSALGLIVALCFALALGDSGV